MGHRALSRLGHRGGVKPPVTCQIRSVAVLPTSASRQRPYGSAGCRSHRGPGKTRVCNPFLKYLRLKINSIFWRKVPWAEASPDHEWLPAISGPFFKVLPHSEVLIKLSATLRAAEALEIRSVGALDFRIRQQATTTAGAFFFLDGGWQDCGLGCCANRWYAAR
jgi:hypothetical protein